MSEALDQLLAHEPVERARGARLGDAEPLGNPSYRRLAFPPQEIENTHLRHGQVEPTQWLGRRAVEGATDLPLEINDPADLIVPSHTVSLSYSLMLSIIQPPLTHCNEAIR